MNSLLKALKLKRIFWLLTYRKRAMNARFLSLAIVEVYILPKSMLSCFHLLNNLLILNKKLRKLKNKDYICSIKVFNSLGRDTELKGNAV